MSACAGWCLVGPAGGTDDRVDARVDERVHVRLGGCRRGEVDGDPGTARRDERDVVGRLERCDELEVRRCGDGCWDEQAAQNIGCKILHGPILANCGHGAC